MEPFLGEVRLLPYDFAPRGWAFCNGQLVAISSNTALFSILGNRYGGNGMTTFALPNLPGRVVPGAGQGPKLKNWDIGMQAGEEVVALTNAEMAAHNHSLIGLDMVGSAGTPASDAWLARDRRGGEGTIRYLAPGGTPVDMTLAAQALTATGGGQAHENRQPFLSLNFCIAIEGIIPPRPPESAE